MMSLTGQQAVLNFMNQTDASVSLNSLFSMWWMMLNWSV